MDHVAFDASVELRPIGLAALEARLRQDLEWLDQPAKPWVPERRVDGQAVLDAVIVGAGMCGLAAGAALQLLGIRNIVLLDRAAAGQEGPWATFARMETLRSPKTLVGPALGLPALTPRAWYEAQHGRGAWEALGKIPRTLWMDYLTWYRHARGLPVRNGVSVVDIQPHSPALVTLTLEGGEKLLARHVILANGRDGLGGPFVPPELVAGLARQRWAHSADDIDFAALRGRRVGVVGAGASAMDNAATALEAGASSVDLFIRRTDIPRANKFTGIGSQGVVHGFESLSDDWKWRFLDHALTSQTPPPRESTLRVSRQGGRFHLGSPVLSVMETPDGLEVRTPKGLYPLDFMIFATGFRFDPSARPELSAVAGRIRLWGDAGTPANAELAASPRLDAAYGFEALDAADTEFLSRLHCFNYHATLSHGKLSGDIPAVSEGATRLAHGIARAVFVEDKATHFAALVAFATPELRGDEWVDADL